MVIAADYPFLDILWTMIIFFTWVVWIWIMIVILTDVFRRHDISGWIKALWVVFLIVLPFLGALVYLIAQHDGMAQRSAKQAESQKAEFDDYVRGVAGGSRRGDREGQGAARQRGDQAGGVRGAQGQGARRRLTSPLTSPRSARRPGCRDARTRGRGAGSTALLVTTKIASASKSR